MTKHHLTGTIARTKIGRTYEYFRLNLKATKAARLAFDRDPKRLMTDFLKRKGFKVNSIRVLRKKNIKDAALGQRIEVGVARDAHIGPSASGWV